MKPQDVKIGIAGAGRLLNHLAPALHRHGYNIQQVWNRDRQKGQALAHAVEATLIPDLQSFNPFLDLIIIGVSDHAIDDVSGEIPPGRYSVCHTSGASETDVLNPHLKKGILYPLQTFSPNRLIEVHRIPFLVHADDDATAELITTIAQEISEKVYALPKEEWAIVHLAAVFAGNFTNHMIGMAHEILKRTSMPYEMLEPLIQETVAKALTHDPYKVQTGPAIRGDRDTMRRHMELLEMRSEKELYQMISKNIQKKSEEL
jgi:predicted short-subunit dehydrogenase-like oxidoreductase (DUF2520 family)